MPPLPRYCKNINIPGQCCPSIQCDVPGHGAYNPVPELTAGSLPTPGPTQSPNSHQSTTINQIIVPNQGPITGGTQLPGGGAPVPTGTNIGSLSGKEFPLHLFISNNNKQQWCACTHGDKYWFPLKGISPSFVYQ